MFDIGASELLVIVIVAILVIGPKDMPKALRTAGRWIGKLRRMSNHFRAGIDEVVRQAEIEEMEEKCLGGGLIEGRDGDHAMESPEETL